MARGGNVRYQMAWRPIAIGRRQPFADVDVDPPVASEPLEARRRGRRETAEPNSRYTYVRSLSSQLLSLSLRSFLFPPFFAPFLPPFAPLGAFGSLLFFLLEVGDEAAPGSDHTGRGKWTSIEVNET